jgi:hypothetical protein
MRSNTAAMNDALSSLVLVPSVILISSQKAARPDCARAEPLGRIDRLHQYGSNFRILVQNPGGEIARGLCDRGFEASLQSG